MAIQQETQLIPRKVLFGNPDRTSPKLSPDGVSISFIAPDDGVLNVWVAPAGDLSAAKPVTRDRGRGIRVYYWAYTSRHVLYIQDKDGDENWRIYSVDLESGDTTDLTPLEGVHAMIQTVSDKIPSEIVVGLNDRDPKFHDLYRVNIMTGERRLIQKNEGFMAILTDDDYDVRFAFRMTADGGNEAMKPTEGGGWELFAKIDMEDTITTSPVGFDRSGRILFMIDSRGRDTSAIVAINLDSGEETELAKDPLADVSRVMVHPREKNIQAVAFTYEREKWQVLDESIASDLDRIREVADGEFEIVSRTQDDLHWLVAYQMDTGPIRYYRYEREDKRFDFLFTNRRDLEGLPLAKMHPVVIKSRDGLDLVSYYTLPIGTHADGNLPRPREPLPMVLEVHGGPWGRDSWGFNPIHQLMANRGYAVMSVNFRGSTGIGKAFINASNMEWGGKMHDDLIDAVKWAVKEGIADADRIAISGGSYGGYAALVGLTFTPEIFACGVDIVGPSNLITLLESIPPYWEPMVELWATRVGDGRTEEGRAHLNERSPLNRVDSIRRPLLIGQGANDPRVKKAESDQIVRAMQDRGIPVTYVLYPDEGHGFARPANRLSFMAIAEAFLAEHLGGRSEGVGSDFEGSSMSIQTGAELVIDSRAADR